jgi:hypothetical protein
VGYGILREMPLFEASLPMRIDRYELHDVIAAGGMATVHIGRLVGPAGFGRTVAIKRLHPHLAKEAEFVSMLTDEARVTGRIGHPNLVPTLDVVADRGELFLVMEYVTGLTLASLTRKASEQGERIPISVACAIMVGVLRGLDAAHEARDENARPLEVVHRDVSPQNIIVGADGLPRLLDFGVAKAAGRLQTTRDGQLKGKLGYMAPEQLGALPIDRRTDVYAAAVVLWETLSGERLFDADDAAGTFGHILQKKIPPPSSQRGDVPPELDALILRGLEREPSLRFLRARDMATAIENNVSIARASEIADWVAFFGEIELAERAELVAAMSQSAGAPDARAPRLRTRRRMAVATIALGAATLVAVLRGAMKSEVTSDPAGSASRAGQQLPGVAPPAIAIEAPPLESPSMAALDRSAESARGPTNTPSPARTATARAAAARAPAAAKPRPPKAAACDPPFTIDEVGHKHYKVDCL